MASLADRSRFASPIIMLLVGMGIAYLPGVPRLTIDPELALLTLLPPILYAAGVGMSWRGFRSNLRPILLLAVGCVAFTATAVAGALHWLVGLPLALGFVLGAIVSPPDVVAPAAALRTVTVPRRIRTVLEGESLINDATALVVFSFAVAAVTTGRFSLVEAAGSFVAIVAGDLVWGVAVGWAMLNLRHVVDDPRGEVLIALATPFIAFWPPHEFGGSGVVACVAAGLWVSWNGRRRIRPATRLQGYFIWGLVTWTIEGTAFLLTGLQAPTLLAALGGAGWSRAATVAAVTCATVVIVRFLWVYPATYLTRLLPAVRRVDPAPDWRTPFFISSAGVRGVVSVIAALSIPLGARDGPFPDRDTILVATFAVVLVTMVGLGGALRPLALTLGLDRAGRAERDHDREDERAVRREGIARVLAALDDAPAEPCTAEEVAALRRRHRDRLAGIDGAGVDSDRCSRPAGALQLRLIGLERDAINGAYSENRLTDEARRRIEREIDLEEARIRHAVESTGSSA